MYHCVIDSVLFRRWCDCLCCISQQQVQVVVTVVNFLSLSRCCGGIWALIPDLKALELNYISGLQAGVWTIPDVYASRPSAVLLLNLCFISHDCLASWFCFSISLWTHDLMCGYKSVLQSRFRADRQSHRGIDADWNWRVADARLYVDCSVYSSRHNMPTTNTQLCLFAFPLNTWE